MEVEVLNALYEAIVQDNVQALESLLVQGVDVNSKLKGPLTCILVAVEKGNLNTVEHLLRNGANVNSRFPVKEDAYTGSTLLYRSVVMGQEEMAKMLIRFEADVNAGNTDGSTCLHVAAERGSLSLAKFLIENGVNTNATTDFFYESDPFIANFNESQIRCNNLDLRHTDASIPFFQENNSPLHIAVKGGRKDFVQLLLEKGANINETTIMGESALSLAVHQGCEEMVELLLNHGPSLDVEGNKNSLSIAVEFQSKEFKKIASKLFAYGFTEDPDYDQHRFVLLDSIRNGHLGIARNLVANRDDIPFFHWEYSDDDSSSESDEIIGSGRRSRPYSCLYAAIQTRNDEWVRLLLNKDENINGEPGSGYHPLLLAIKENNFNAVKLLVERGVNIQNDGKVLAMAAQKGCTKTVSLLLQKGADFKRTVNFEDLQRPRYDYELKYYIEERDIFMAGIYAPVNHEISALHVAAEEGHADVVKLLLNCGVPANIKTESLMSPLLIASARGHLNVVETLLKSGATVKTSDCLGRTPVYMAAHYRHVNVLKLLLRYGASMNRAIINTRSTPLHVSAAHGYSEIVEILLKSKAYLSLADHSGKTPIFYAAEKGHLAVVKLLLTHGAFINEKSRKGTTPLFLAASNGHLDTVEILLQNGMNIHLTDYSNKTALFYAVENGHYRVVELLLKYGAEVNALDVKRNTPLIVAVEKGHLNSVDVLLRHGAKVNILNSTGETLLSVALKNNHDDVFKMLLERSVNFKSQAEINASLLNFVKKGEVSIVDLLLNRGACIRFAEPDADGKTALHLAAEHGHAHLIDLLLRNGSESNGKDANGRTALSLAAENGFLPTVAILLNCGAGIDIADHYGKTALFFSAENDRMDVLKLLVDFGANLNSVAENYTTPLLIAIERGHTVIAESLIKYGAFVNGCDLKGRTALHFAAEFGFEDLIILLRDNGAEINAMTESCKTPLFLSAEKGHLKSVEILFHAGADINGTTAHSRLTALHLAAENGHSPVVRFLLENGADVYRNYGRKIPLLILCAERGYYSTLLHLMEFGASVDLSNQPDIQDYLVRTLKKWNNMPAFECLLEYGSSDLTIVSESHVYALYESIRRAAENDQLYSRDQCLEDIIVMHIVKMNAAGFFNRRENLVSPITSNESIINTENDDRDSIEIMKSTFVGTTNITFYDVLSKNLNCLARYCEIAGFSSEFSRSSFPLPCCSPYRSILRNQFKKGKIRSKLLSDGIEILTPIFNCVRILPHDIIRMLVEYLSNQNLRFLIYAHKGFVIQNH